MCSEETTDGYDVILSGPITGVPDYALRFAKAYVQQRQRAFHATGRLPKVWNPAELPAGRAYWWYMRRCVDAIFASPAATVAMLPGWEESKGARAEHALAVCLRMKVEVV
jgi:hypothetical protein